MTVHNAKLERFSETSQNVVFRVNTEEERGYIPASRFPDEIQYKEHLVRQELETDVMEHGDVWAQPLHRKPFNEARLIKSINQKRNYLCVLNEVGKS